MPDTSSTHAPRSLNCPHCASPRFLAEVTGSLEGVIEIKCRKCCRFATFDAATGECIQATRAYALKIDLIYCKRCTGQIARWSLRGTGAIRQPCLLRRWLQGERQTCKHENRTVLDITPSSLVAEGA